MTALTDDNIGNTVENCGQISQGFLN